jgi:hypothetical protein
MDDAEAEAEAEERAERAAAVAEELAADWAARSPGDAGSCAPWRRSSPR